MADEPAPKPDFGFIMKEEPKPKRAFKLPGNLPKPILFGGAGVFLLLLLLVVGSLLGGNKNANNVYTLLSDASVISGVAEQSTIDSTAPDIKNLAATIKGSLDSQQQDLKTYLASNKTKVNSKLIKTLPPASVTSQLTTAKQNNTYDKALAAYFKSSLNSYQADLRQNYKVAGPKLKVILDSAYYSNETVLKSKLLAN